MKKFFQLNEAVANFLIIVFILIMLVSISLQVLFRYVFQSPLAWSEEMARFSLIWLSFLGAGLLVLEGDHFSIDLFTRILSERKKWVCYTCANLAIIFFGSIMVWGGVKMVTTVYFVKSTALRIPMGFIYAAMPLGGIIIIMNSIHIIISRTFIDRK